MREFKKLGLLVFIVFFVTIFSVKAQIPVNDPTSWHLQASYSDEFNTPTIDFTNKWWSYGSSPGWGAEYLIDSNLMHGVSDTILKIRIDTIKPSNRWIDEPYSDWAENPNDGVHYAYQGSALISKNVSGVDVYNFGYLEISAKYPDDSIYPLWLAFWVWSANCNSAYYNEIDICENSAEDSYSGNIMGTNIHVNSTTCDLNYALNYGLSCNVGTTISNGYHKYAIEWAPDRIIWYFDNEPVRSFYDADGDSIPQEPMAAILGFGVDPWHSYLPSDWNDHIIYPPDGTGHGNELPTSFPQYFKIDYLRYYKLNTDCNTDLTICNPGSDYSGRAVKKSITTGGSGVCAPTFNPSTSAGSYTLRATDYVLLNDSTTINPTSSGYFAIQIMDCPQ